MDSVAQKLTLVSSEVNVLSVGGRERASVMGVQENFWKPRVFGVQGIRTIHSLDPERQR